MDEDQLIRQFMQAHREEISDSGFSNRVMRHIPTERPFWMFCVASILVVAALIAMFIWQDGWHTICTFAVKAIETAVIARYSTVNPLAIIVLVGFIIWYMADRVKSIA